jgi:hypothetical protein
MNMENLQWKDLINSTKLWCVRAMKYIKVVFKIMVSITF